jgi:hypothetical protein
MSLSLSPLLLSLCVSLCWGLTNPLLASRSRSLSSAAESPLSRSALNSTLSLLRSIHFLLPLLINQLGSVIFVYLVSRPDSALSFAVPVTNGLTTAVTLAAEHSTANTNRFSLIGVAFIVAGLSIVSS